MCGVSGWLVHTGHWSWKEKNSRSAPVSSAQFTSRTYWPCSFTWPVWHRRSAPICESSKVTIVSRPFRIVSLIVANCGLTGLYSCPVKETVIVRPASHRSKDTCRHEEQSATAHTNDIHGSGQRAHLHITQLRIWVSHNEMCTHVTHPITIRFGRWSIS